MSDLSRLASGLPGGLALIIAITLALACSSTPWDDTSPGRSCPVEHDAFDDCCCFFSEEQLCPGDGPICAISVACAEDAWIPGEGCPLSGTAGQSTVIVNAEAIDCALQALRDTNAREVSWALQSRIDLPSPTNQLTQTILFTGEAREVYVIQRGFTDGTSPAPDVPMTRRTLRPPAYFEECALHEDPRARLECLMQAVEGPEIEVCEGT